MFSAIYVDARFLVVKYSRENWWLSFEVPALPILSSYEFIPGIAIQGIGDFTCMDHFNHFITMESIR